MKKTLAKFLSVVMIVVFVFNLVPVTKVNAIVYKGSGTNSDPYILEFQKTGKDTMDYVVSSTGDGYAYFTLKFTKSFKITLKNEGDYTMYLNGKSLPYFNSVLFKSGTIATLKVRGNKGSRGKLYISLEDAGDSLEEWNSRENAKDITAGYNSLDKEFENYNGYVWYKFCITKQSVINLTFNIKDTFFDIYDADLNTIIDHGQNSKDGMMNYFNVRRMQGTEKEDYVSYKIFSGGHII